jgi:hypothetical protein
MNVIISIDLINAALRSDDCADLSRDTLERDARDYARFLVLAQLHPDEPIAPTRAIDRMWHLHMLHPRAYHADCLAIFGDLLDHDGGFGSTPEEAPVLAEAFRRTALLWEATFGEPYMGTGAGVVACKRNCVSRCQRRCKTVDRQQGGAA